MINKQFPAPGDMELTFHPGQKESQLLPDFVLFDHKHIGSPEINTYPGDCCSHLIAQE